MQHTVYDLINVHHKQGKIDGVIVMYRDYTARVKEQAENVYFEGEYPETPGADKDKLIESLVTVLTDVNKFIDKELDHRQKMTKCLRLVQERSRLQKKKESLLKELHVVSDKLMSNSSNLLNMVQYD